MNVQTQGDMGRLIVVKSRNLHKCVRRGERKIRQFPIKLIKVLRGYPNRMVNWGSNWHIQFVTESTFMEVNMLFAITNSIPHIPGYRL
jgi:hypothetical protein